MHLRFKLTLLSAFVLTACSGGGGSGSNHTPQAEMPKVNHQQPQKQQNPIAKDNKRSDAELSKQPKVEAQKPSVTETSKPPMDEKSKSPVDETSKPSVDNTPKKELTDADHFQKLNPFGRDHLGTRLVKLSLDGKDIVLSPVNDSLNINHKNVEILRDNSGRLIGYYGYASVTEKKPRYHSSDELIAKHHFVPLLDIDPNINAIEPTQNMRYDGKMYYHYVDIPAEVLKADVVASYSHQDKHFSMLITNDQSYWELRGSPTQKYVTLNTEEEVRDNIAGILYTEDNQPKAQFIGGIYGSQGEILAGYANSAEEQGREAWKGVVKAAAKTTK